MGCPCNLYVEESQHDQAFEVALSLPKGADIAGGLKAAGIYALTKEQLMKKVK